MRSLHALTVILAFVVLAALPNTAKAHPRGSSFRLGLGLPALSVQHFPGIDATQVTYGLNSLTFGLHLGVQVSGSVGLAVHVLGGGVYTDTPGAPSSNVVIFSVAPRFEYMFNPHGTFAPYLGVQVGYSVSGDTDTNLVDLLRMGGFFGGHIFAVSRFSVDLEIALDYLYNFDNQESGFQATLYFSLTGWLD